MITPLYHLLAARSFARPLSTTPMNIAPTCLSAMTVRSIAVGDHQSFQPCCHGDEQRSWSSPRASKNTKQHIGLSHISESQCESKSPVSIVNAFARLVWTAPKSGSIDPLECLLCDAALVYRKRHASMDQMHRLHRLASEYLALSHQYVFITNHVHVRYLS